MIKKNKRVAWAIFKNQRICALLSLEGKRVLNEFEDKDLAWKKWLGKLKFSAPFAFLAPLLAVAVAFFLKKEGGRRAKWRAPPLPPKTNGERRRSTPPLLATLSFSCQLRIVSYPLARFFFVSTNDFCLGSDGEYQGGCKIKRGKIRRKKITYHRDLGHPGEWFFKNWSCR